jgi:hypothetical protein
LNEKGKSAKPPTQCEPGPNNHVECVAKGTFT